MEVVSLSLGRNILDPESRDRARMRLYAKRLSAYRIIVLTRKEHGYAEEVHEGTLHLYPTNSSSKLSMVFDAFRVGRRILKKNREPAIVSAQDPLELGWLSYILSRAYGARLHLQIHGDYFGGAWDEGSFVKKLKLFFAMRLLKKAPAIRVVSERIKHSLLTRGIPEARITVLPIRPELEAFLAVSRTVSGAPPYTLLYLGRLAPEKDIPRIIHAFACLRGEGKDVRLRIVGSGSEEAALQALVKTLNLSESVTFVPWTKDVPGEMSKADIFLLASKHEAYALTLVEAMAAGLPMVTTDVGCVGEVVRDGVHGIVVYKKNVQSFACAIQKILLESQFRKSCSVEEKKTARFLAQVSTEDYVKEWIRSMNLENK